VCGGKHLIVNARAAWLKEGGKKGTAKNSTKRNKVIPEVEKRCPIGLRASKHYMNLHTQQ